MTKNDIRQLYKSKRTALTAAERDTYSLAIANQCLSLPIWNRTYFHVFLSIARLHEIDTEPLLHLLAGKDKSVVVSRSDFGTGTMQHFLLEDGVRLRENAYGIPEPEGGTPVTTDALDVIFVPLLAFDQAGNRVGYGKGFYDRFLAHCRPDAVKVGLSFFPPVASWEDVFESDVRLDYCVTPEGVFDFRKTASN